MSFSEIHFGNDSTDLEVQNQKCLKQYQLKIAFDVSIYKSNWLFTICLSSDFKLMMFILVKKFYLYSFQTIIYIQLYTSECSYLYLCIQIYILYVLFEDLR